LTVSLAENENKATSRAFSIHIALAYMHASQPESIKTFKAFTMSFIAVRFVAKGYILQQKCLNRQIGTRLLGTRWYNF